MSIYSVPSSICFRQWGPDSDQQTRRLLLKNGGDASISFRLTLPGNAALKVSGADLEQATSELNYVELAPMATASFVVTFLPICASGSDIRESIIVRTRRQWLHVSLFALKDANSQGPPDAYETPPQQREHWDNDSDDDDDWGDGAPVTGETGGRSPGRRKRLPKISSDGEVKVTPAKCTDPDELSFYKQLIKEELEVETAKQQAAEAESSLAEKADRACEESEAVGRPRVELVQVRLQSTLEASELPPVPESPMSVVSTRTSMRHESLPASAGGLMRSSSVGGGGGGSQGGAADEELEFYQVGRGMDAWAWLVKWVR